MPRVLVGIDLVKISETADSVERFGDRYLQRLYTATERADCQRRGTSGPASLAARFAAKEALLKALQPDPDETPEWTSIEIVISASGAPSLRLHGTCAGLADSRRVRSLAVSLTHEGEYASAVVVAMCDADEAAQDWRAPVIGSVSEPSC